MKERPILFNDPMVRAILSGQKTQTRRVVNPYPPAQRTVIPYRPSAIVPQQDGTFAAYTDSRKFKEFTCPYGQPGERLWVRECWAPIGMTELCTGKQRTSYEYRAGRLVLKQGQEPAIIEQEPFFHVDRWYPSIHMPRAACRLVLEIVSVRVERLQDISREDAIAEGVQWDDAMGGYHVDDGSHFNASFAAESYRSLWKHINGAESWAANPWVWVINFKRTP